jgi:hypothetical protein
MAARNATTTSGTHMSTSRGDHIPNNIDINSNIEIWCPFSAFNREHMLYSTFLCDDVDHFLVQRNLSVARANFLRHTDYNNQQSHFGDQILDHILRTGTSTPSLDSSRGDNEYDGRSGSRDEPEAEAFVQ